MLHHFYFDVKSFDVLISVFVGIVDYLFDFNLSVL